MNMNNSPPRNIKSLTSLRFVFMLMIFLCHLEFLSNLTDSYMQYFHNGYIAVPFFFMMSGFGLTFSFSYRKKIAMDGRWNPVKGYMYGFKKLKKLYTAYLISMAMVVPLLLFELIDDGRTWTYSIGSLSIKYLFSMTMLQSILGIKKYSHMFNGVGWFLSTLLILYVFYPLLEILNAKFFLTHDKKRSFFALIVLFACRIPMFYFFEFLMQKFPFFTDLTYGFPGFRITEFAIGILICNIFLNSTKMGEKNKKLGSLMESVAFVLVFAWWLLRNSMNMDFLPIVTKIEMDVFVAMFTLYVFCFQGGVFSRVLSIDGFVLLGKSTMFIYLFHYPVRLIVDEVTRNCCESISVAVAINIFVIVVMTGVFTVVGMKIKEK